MPFVDGVRWMFRGRSIGASSAARRHKLYSARPA